MSPGLLAGARTTAGAAMFSADGGGPATATRIPPATLPTCGEAATQGRVCDATTPTCGPAMTRVATAGANTSWDETNAYGILGTKPIPTATPRCQHHAASNGAQPRQPR